MLILMLSELRLSGRATFGCQPPPRGAVRILESRRDEPDLWGRTLRG